MKFNEIPIGEIFTIGDTPSYPKYKTENGYIDIRDEIVKNGDCVFPVRLMTDDEIKIAFYGVTREEAKRISKERFSNFGHYRRRRDGRLLHSALMNKQEVEKIIDKFATYKPCSCVSKGACNFCGKGIRKHVLLGDVLEKWYAPTDEQLGELYELWKEAVGVLDVDVWASRGLSKSLQQIVDDSGWFEEDICPMNKDMGSEEQLRLPSARELFEFLKTIKS